MRFGSIIVGVWLFLPLHPAPAAQLPQRLARLERDAEEAFIWGDYQRAKGDYLDLISLWADPELLIRWRQRLARCYEKLGQGGEAIRAYQLLLYHLPQAEEAKWALARLYLKEGNYRAATAWLAACGEKGVALHFLMGYSFTKLGEWRKAIDHLKTLNRDYPLYDYALYLLGKCYLNLGEPANSVHLLSQVPEQSSLYRRSQRLIVKAHIQLGNFPQALDIIKNWGDNIDFLLQAGEIYESMGKTSTALNHYIRAIQSFPQNPLACKVVEKIKRIKGERLNPLERFLIGRVYFHKRKWREAIEQFEAYLNSHPRGRWADEATFLKASSLFRLGEYLPSRSTYLSVIARFPQSPFAIKSKIKVALCDWKLGNLHDAFWRFRDFSLRYPKEAEAEKALFLAGRVLEESGDYPGAATQYLMAQTHYPQGRLADQSLWRAAFCYYQTEDWLRSLSLLRRFSQLYGQSPFLKTTLYWRFKIYQRMGKINQAKRVLKELAQEYPYSYYGLKAKSLLSGRDEFTPFISSSSGLMIKVKRFREIVRERSHFAHWVRRNFRLSGSPSLEENPHFQKGRLLANLGLIKEAKAEFTWVEKAEWGDPLALSNLLSLYSQFGWNLRGHKVASWIESWAQKNGQNDLPPYLHRWLYPVHLLDEVWQRCHRANLDPLFVLALIRRESRFDPAATSRSGALGLMQIMPSTGKEVAHSLGRMHTSPEELYQMDLNLDLGIRYLLQQLHRFGGRPEMALAAYNGGPTNVLRWKRGLKEPLDIDCFVERIDYSQTRAYLKMVLKDYVRYKQIWRER